MNRLLFVVLVLIASTVVVVSATDPPSLPMSIEAQVVIDGAPAPVGTTVEAICENIYEDSSSVVLSREGEFGNQGPFDPRIIIQGSDVLPGTAIGFEVNGVSARIKYHGQEFGTAIVYVPGEHAGLEIHVVSELPQEEETTQVIVTPEPTPIPTPEPTTPVPTPEPTPIPTQTYSYLPQFSAEDQSVIDYMKTIDERYVAETAHTFETYRVYWYIHDYVPNTDKIDCRKSFDPSSVAKFNRMFRYAECGGYKPRPDLDAMLEAQNYEWFKQYGIDWSYTGWTRVPKEWVGLYGLPSMYVPSEGLVRMCECPPDGSCCQKT